MLSVWRSGLVYLDILPCVPSHHEPSISLNVQPKWPATAICRYIPQIDYNYNYNYNYTATPPRPLPFYFMILQFFSHQNFWTFCPQRIRDQIKIKFWIDWAESEHSTQQPSSESIYSSWKFCLRTDIHAAAALIKAVCQRQRRCQWPAAALILRTAPLCSTAALALKVSAVKGLM